MKIKCEFRNILASGVEYYGCEVSTALILKPGTEIKAFVGNHLPGKSNEDVEMIWFCNTTVEYFPRGLHKIFSKLTALAISDCGLKLITRVDLRELEGLELLYLYSNELQSLPSDLFVGMLKLQEISFNENKLEFLISKLLEPITGNRLQYVSFRNNTNINAFYSPGNAGSVASFQDLMDLIDLKCGVPKDEMNEELVRNYITGFKELWESKDFSDFIIISGGRMNGKTKEFAVHKNVLSAQSLVFTAVFKNDMKEKQTGKMVIDDFGADVVEGMLQFIYTGELQEVNAMDLFAIASKYDIKALKNVTEQIIMRNLNESNAIEVFGLAHLYNSGNLKCAAFEAIQKMFPDVEIQETLMDEPENLKQLVDIHRKIQKAKAELSSALKKFSI